MLFGGGTYFQTHIDNWRHDRGGGSGRQGKSGQYQKEYGKYGDANASLRLALDLSMTALVQEGNSVMAVSPGNREMLMKVSSHGLPESQSSGPAHGFHGFEGTSVHVSTQESQRVLMTGRMRTVYSTTQVVKALSGKVPVWCWAHDADAESGWMVDVEQDEAAKARSGGKGKSKMQQRAPRR